MTRTTPQTTTRTTTLPHLTTIEGGAATVRTTSHTRVGGVNGGVNASVNRGITNGVDNGVNGSMNGVVNTALVVSLDSPVP